MHDPANLPRKPRFPRFRRRRATPLPARVQVLPGAHEGPRNPSYYILPNLFTSASLFLALFSITLSAQGLLDAALGGDARASFFAACWCILAAAVCDAFDGPVARLTRTSSNFGLQYDSLADVVAFGLAPAFLMFANLRTLDHAMLPEYAPKLALGACALFVICAAIRLARFNVQAETTEKSFFTGLPSPGAAGAVVTGFLFIEWLTSLPQVVRFEDAAWMARTLHRSSLILMVCLALLMVSEVRFPKLRDMPFLSGNPINVLVAIITIVCVMIAFAELLPVLLFGLFMVYIIGSAIGHARHSHRVRRRPRDEEVL